MLSASVCSVSFEIFHMDLPFFPILIFETFNSKQRLIGIFFHAMTLCPPKGLLLTFYLHGWPLPFSASSPSVHSFSWAMENHRSTGPTVAKNLVDAVPKLPFLRFLVKIPYIGTSLAGRGQTRHRSICCFPTPQCANMQ